MFLNCNKIKELKIKVKEIIDALDGSEKVEVSADKKQIRRAHNLALPPKEGKDARAKES